jgi:hypothetical protein
VITYYDNSKIKVSFLIPILSKYCYAVMDGDSIYRSTIEETTTGNIRDCKLYTSTLAPASLFHTTHMKETASAKTEQSSA